MTDTPASPTPSARILASRRRFLAGAGLGGAALAAPAIVRAQAPIRWRLQTYSGAPLGAHVILPQVEAFNAAAGGEMEIELYYADQLVPTGELFRALQNGTVDAVQSDEATMASPVDISVFGGYFPFATRYPLDVPALFTYYGLEGHLGRGLRRGGERHLALERRLGPAPRLHRGEAHPLARRHERAAGVRRAHRRAVPRPLRPDPSHRAVGRRRGGHAHGRARWSSLVRLHRGLRGGLGGRVQLRADQLGHRGLVRLILRQLRVLGEGPPPPPAALPVSTIDQSHYYRATWYWGGEAKLRVEGEKMELTSIPPEEWAQVIEDARGLLGRDRRPRAHARPRWSRPSRPTRPPWRRRAIPIAEDRRHGVGEGLRRVERAPRPKGAPDPSVQGADRAPRPVGARPWEMLSASVIVSASAPVSSRARRENEATLEERA